MVALKLTMIHLVPAATLCESSYHHCLGKSQDFTKKGLRENFPKSLSDKCPREDSNLHGVLTPLGPQPSASANSATWARKDEAAEYRLENARTSRLTAFFAAS